LSRLERIATIAGWVVAAWFGLVAAWGMFGTLGGGHYAVPASTALSAENMLRWHIIAPYWDYTAVAPLPSQYYCHHPFFCFWVYVPLIALFGHHSWYLFVPPVLMSIATVLCINRAAMRVWGPLGALAATAGFAMLPITLAYSNFNNLEVPTIFGWALFFWGHTGMLRTWKLRYVIASALGAAVTASSDWIGYVVLGAMLGWTMLRVVFPQRLFPPIKIRRYAQWWILCTGITCALFGFWLLLFNKYGQVGDLLGSASSRTSGGNIPLDVAIEARRYRVDICFTPFAILLGKIAVPFAIIRLIVRRRDEEMFSLACLLAATIQYVGFKQGADIHVFWPHYYGIYFAFAFAQLVLSLRWIFEKILVFARRPWAKSAAFAGAGVFVVFFVIAMIPDAVRGLVEGRETWGRYNEERIRSEADAVRVVENIAPRMPRGATLDGHNGMHWSWALSWATYGLHADTPGIPKRGGDVEGHPFFVARIGGISPAEMKTLANDFHLEIYGEFIVVDRRRSPGPLDAYVFEEKSKNPFAWYFLGETEPGKLVYDPFATWEWRHHLGQPATPPTEAPRTPEQIRIAHNLAVAEGNAQRAAEMRQKLEAMLARDDASDFTQGVRLLGLRHVAGAGPRYDVVVLAAQGAPACEAQFGVHAYMMEKSSWSWVRPDTLVRDLTQLMSFPASLWKPGFIYAIPTWIYHRTGVERFEGVFWCGSGVAAPTRIGAPNAIDLMTLR
jgi:4-amino-4-deoxy-L-arabinose transferase-like glycosyltransferase